MFSFAHRNAADDGIGKTEVELSVTQGMGKRNVQSFRLLTQFGNGQANSTITARVALFVA